MSRKKSHQPRKLIPDPKYGEVSITKFVNALMQHGKKSVAERIMYGALDILKEKTKRRSNESFQKSD